MKELIRKALFTGVGVASLTKEKIEEVVDELKKSGEMSEEEGKKFTEELFEKAKESKEKLNRQIEEAVSSAIEKLDIARGADIAELKKEIDALKKQGE